MLPERVTLAINGDYLSNGRTCSDEHETEQNKKETPDDHGRSQRGGSEEAPV